MPPSSPFPSLSVSLFCSSVPSIFAVGGISTISQTGDVNQCHSTDSGQSHVTAETLLTFQGVCVSGMTSAA